MIVRVALAGLVAVVALSQAVANGDTPVRVYLKTSGFYGAVNMSPSGTQLGDCTTYCTFAFERGTNVRLTATPAAGSFVQWSPFASRIGSLCSGTSPTCEFTLNNSTAIRAIFSPVSLRVASTDGGSVTVQNPGPRCGSDCYLYQVGDTASIHAEALADNAFRGWSGGCLGAGPDCAVNMSDNRSLGASFDCTADVCSIRQPLTTKLNFWVKVIGGNVSGSISCGGSCFKSVGVGQQLSLQTSRRVQWLSRVIRCATGSTRCTFRVGRNSTSYSPLLVVRFY